MSIIITPSILAADFAHLAREVNHVIEAGADWIHIDVMDNHYVPNLTFGPIVCEALKKAGITAPLDVHLMVKPVDGLIQAFAKAGASYITIHPEATDHCDRSLQLIRDLGCKAGLALNPATPLHHLDHVMEKLDLILIMSVNPGFGGQAFIPSALAKINAVRKRIDASGQAIHLAVDGGIKCDTIKSAYDAGADTFVAGTAIFHSDDYQQTITTLRNAVS